MRILTLLSGRPSTRHSDTKQDTAPCAEMIEQRVTRSKERWKTPLDENMPTFPRSQDRPYSTTNFTTETTVTPQARMGISSSQEENGSSPDSNKEQVTPIRMAPVQNTPRSPKPRQLCSPMSPSVYSRNTDGISILPNDSIMSFENANEDSFSHENGSAVIITSRAVRSYAIGTPSPKGNNNSNHSTKDWKAWLSHEVSELDCDTEQDITIHDKYSTPTGHTPTGHRRELTEISGATTDSVVDEPSDPSNEQEEAREDDNKQAQNRLVPSGQPDRATSNGQGLKHPPRIDKSKGTYR